MVAIDADGREIADPAQLRHVAGEHCRARQQAPDRRPRPARSRRSGASSRQAPSGPRPKWSRRRTGRARSPPRAAARISRGERVVPATDSLAPDKSGKGAAGIAGAENEEARAHAAAPVAATGAPVAPRPLGAHVVVHLPRRMCVGQRVESGARQQLRQRPDGGAAHQRRRIIEQAGGKRRPAQRRRNCRRRSARCAGSDRGRCA